MKILILTQVLPYPPDSGPKIKTFALIRYLSRRHDLTLVSFIRGDQSAAIQSLTPFCKEIHTVPIQRGLLRDGVAFVNSLITGEPWLIVRDRREEMVRLISRVVENTQFDAVHCDQLNMTQYAPAIPGVLRVFDAHNALWKLYQRIASTSDSALFRFLYKRDWPLLKLYEGKICRDFDNVLTVSETDAQALQEAAGRKIQCVTIPISIDTENEPIVGPGNGSGHILHIGTMYWQPNIEGVLWFIEKVYPKIRAENPTIQFDIVGARPPKSLSRYKEDHSGINVTGYVEDVTPFLMSAGVFVVPLLAGSGMRVKILEAFARGLPVVSTSIGCEGIEVVNREHLYIADDPAGFASCVNALLADPGEAARIAQNGRALVEQKYDLNIALTSIRSIYPDPN